MSARAPRWTALLAWVACAAPLGAQVPAEPEFPGDPDQDLSTRMQELEEEVLRLQHQLGQGPDGAPTRFPVLSKLEMEIYGYIKLDAAYDTSRTSVGNYARWVETEETNDDDDQLSLTARQTRLGLKLRGPGEGSMQSDALVEIDFYGGDSENKPTPMLRHAYFELLWPESGWELLAGQTSDVISPLNAPTVNYTVAWWQGNVGYRRPQVRVTKRLDLSEDTDLSLQLAASRTVTSRAAEFAPNDGDTGSDSGVPTLQARVGLGLPVTEGGRAEFGLSGHYGKEEQDLDETGENEDAHSWSLCLDARLPLSDRFKLQGELFTGENLDAYLGGIGQGLDQSSGSEIATWGGWIAATMEASELWMVNLGAALENPDNDDLSSGARTENQVYFANAQRSVGAHTILALELSYLDTDYLDLASGDSLRAQFALIYRF